jgi:hypothetical protein
MDIVDLLKRLDNGWQAFLASYAGLSDSELLQPGVAGGWSVRDIIAHVTWWEEEALKHLPTILAKGTPPRYSVTYGGIDAFNDQMTELKKGLALSDVLKQRDEVHQRLVDLIQDAPEDEITRESRFRHRLRLDTYSHYPEHTRAILAWRKARSSRSG